MIINWLKNKFFKSNKYSTNTIILLFGIENLILTSYSDKGFVRTIYIARTDPEFFGKYRSFLNQFKAWHIIIILDDENMKLKTQTAPVIDSIIKFTDNNTNNILSEFGNNDEIAACYTTSVEDESASITNKIITISHTKFSTQLSDILSFIYNFNFPLDGIYILNLEMNKILENIIRNCNLNYKNHLMIFIVPTISSGIRSFILENGAIIESKFLEYPHGKSPDYIAGIIHELGSELLSKYQKITQIDKANIKVISLMPSDTYQALNQIKKDSKNDNHWVTLNWANTSQKMLFKDFGDEILIHNAQLKFPAINTSIMKVVTLEKINHYVMNLAFIIVFLFGLYGLYIQYNIFNLDRYADKINREYYKLSEEYREARNKLHDLNNSPVIYDIISDMNILKAPVTNPLEILKITLDLKEKDSQIEKIIWKNTDSHYINSELVIQMNFNHLSVNNNTAQQVVVDYSDGLKRLLPGYKIESIESNRPVLNLNNQLTSNLKFRLEKID